MNTISIATNGPIIRYTRSDLDGKQDGGLAFVSCATCGVTTHWEPAGETNASSYMAVNAALADPADIAELRIRRFDGADSWEFLD